MNLRERYRWVICGVMLVSCGSLAAQEELPAAPTLFLESPTAPEVVESASISDDFGEPLPVRVESAPVPAELITDHFDEEATRPTFLVPFGYNLTQHDLTWLIGDGDDFGRFSFRSYPALAANESVGIIAGFGVDWLAGPIRSDLPPRVFDFQIGAQLRELVGSFRYDVKFTIGAYSDFEGSARKGVRFPGHAVTYTRWGSRVESVLGVEVLDRDDISLLPVFGWIVRPGDGLQVDLVFPRPRIIIDIDETSKLYVAGELGGGTWAVERTTSIMDNATYSEYQVAFGVMSQDDDGDSQALEVAYVFNRTLEYRSGRGDIGLEDAIMLRLRSHF